MIYKYFYDLERIWYLVDWIEECAECGEFSETPICLKCGTVKQGGEAKVDDPKIIKQLETLNPEVIEKLEKELNGTN